MTGSSAGPAASRRSRLDQDNQAAHTYCARSDFTVVVAGDATKVGPTLDGIGFDVVKVDARGQTV